MQNQVPPPIPAEPTVRENWIKDQWRPMMGWTYMAICIFDFIVGPILRMWFAAHTQAILIPWESLTASDGGLFHMAMGAILGVTAWTRGQEKVQRIDYYKSYNHQYNRNSYNDYDNQSGGSDPNNPPAYGN